MLQSPTRERTSRPNTYHSFGLGTGGFGPNVPTGCSHTFEASSLPHRSSFCPACFRLPLLPTLPQYWGTASSSGPPLSVNVVGEDCNCWYCLLQARRLPLDATPTLTPCTS
ncbi:unnamed protein product, partial [Ectocarpus sp. 6 AP-2014]